MCLNFVGERTQKCDRENRERRWRQILSICRLYLDFIVKQFCYINCLNAWATHCATYRNQKLCCGTVFLDKNDEQKTSSGLQFKTASENVCFLFRANWTRLSRAGGGSYPLPPPPIPPWIRACTQNQYPPRKTTYEDIKIDYMTSQFCLEQLIHEPTHITGD